MQLLGIQADPTSNSEEKSTKVMKILTANERCNDVLDNNEGTNDSKPTEPFKTIKDGPKLPYRLKVPPKKTGGKRGNTRRRSRKSTRRKGRKSNGKKSKRRSRR